jgi:hypothetical protein
VRAEDRADRDGARGRVAADLGVGARGGREVILVPGAAAAVAVVGGGGGGRSARVSQTRCAARSFKQGWYEGRTTTTRGATTHYERTRSTNEALSLCRHYDAPDDEVDTARERAFGRRRLAHFDRLGLSDVPQPLGREGERAKGGGVRGDGLRWSTGVTTIETTSRRKERDGKGRGGHTSPST